MVKKYSDQIQMFKSTSEIAEHVYTHQKVIKNAKPYLHEENSFPNLVKSNKIWIVITLFRKICQQTEFRSVPSLSEMDSCNPNFV